MTPSAPWSPLAGVRVLELGGIGPGPHAGMLLAAMGADVLRIERAGEVRDWDATRRGRTLVAADLKHPEDARRVALLAERADVLIEGFRPGVAARLGFGADVLRARNPRLVYAHMTGWGQTGPWARRAGHDINYISVTGALHAIGAERPTPPLNLVGDFGGGSAYLAIGVLSALVQRAASGLGCEIDGAVVDGTGSLMQLIWSLRADGRWLDERGANALDGGSPYYRTYRCADGRWMAVGAMEAPFYTQFVRGLGLTEASLPDRDERERWPELAAVFAEAFAAYPREHWEQVFGDTDACVTPVLAMSEAAGHPHLAARGVLRAEGAAGYVAAVAPRLVGAEAGYLPTSQGSTLDAALAEHWPAQAHDSAQ